MTGFLISYLVAARHRRLAGLRAVRVGVGVEVIAQIYEVISVLRFKSENALENQGQVCRLKICPSSTTMAPVFRIQSLGSEVTTLRSTLLSDFRIANFQISAGPFSAVSTPLIAGAGSFFSASRDLSHLHSFAPPLHRVLFCNFRQTFLSLVDNSSSLQALQEKEELRMRYKVTITRMQDSLVIAHRAKVRPYLKAPSRFFGSTFVFSILTNTLSPKRAVNTSTCSRAYTIFVETSVRRFEKPQGEFDTSN